MFKFMVYVYYVNKEVLFIVVIEVECVVFMNIVYGIEFCLGKLKEMLIMLVWVYLNIVFFLVGLVVFCVVIGEVLCFFKFVWMFYLVGL